jgi:hypothetical protein
VHKLYLTVSVCIYNVGVKCVWVCACVLCVYVCGVTGRACVCVTDGPAWMKCRGK